jgi:hypothetical protein
MHVYRNDVLELNEAPTMPTGLEAAVQSENSVLLSWLPSSDDHTPAPAITYDLLLSEWYMCYWKCEWPTTTILTRLPEPEISAQ